MSESDAAGGRESGSGSRVSRSVEDFVGQLRAFTDRADFEQWLNARPNSPRRTRDELWASVAEPLTPQDLDIPLAEAPDPRSSGWCEGRPTEVLVQLCRKEAA